MLNVRKKRYLRYFLAACAGILFAQSLRFALDGYGGLLVLTLLAALTCVSINISMREKHRYNNASSE